MWLHLWFGVRKSDEVRPTHTSLPGRILPATSTTFSSEVTLPSTCPHTLHSIPVARVKPKGFSGWWLEQPNTKRKLAPHQVNFSLPLPLTLHGCFGTQKPHWNSSAQTKSRMGQGTLGPSREAWQPWPWWADGSDGHGAFFFFFPNIRLCYHHKAWELLLLVSQLYLNEDSVLNFHTVGLNTSPSGSISLISG